MRLRPSAKGFTLIELSIVLAVVGLIIGGVLVGREVLGNARLKTVADEISQVRDAIADFKATYDALPGDMFNARDRLGNGDASVGNGNGNGVIDSTAERLLVWQHLALANKIPGSYDGTAGGAGAEIVPSQNTMASTFDKNVVFDVQYTPTGAVLVSAYRCGTTCDAAAGQASFLKPEEAQSIDRRFDDGNPTTGLIVAANGSDAGGAAGDCVTGANAYNSTNKRSLCRLTISDTPLTTASGTPQAVAATSAVAVTAATATGTATPDRCVDPTTNASQAVGSTRTVRCSEVGITGTDDGFGNERTCTVMCSRGGTWDVFVDANNDKANDIAAASTCQTRCTFDGCPAATFLTRNAGSGTDYGTADFPASAVNAVTQILATACQTGYERTDPSGTPSAACPSTASYPTLACRPPGGSAGWYNGDGMVGACKPQRCCPVNNFTITNGTVSHPPYTSPSGGPNVTTVNMPLTPHQNQASITCPNGFGPAGSVPTPATTATALIPCSKGTFDYSKFDDYCDPRDCTATSFNLSTAASLATNPSWLAATTSDVAGASNITLSIPALDHTFDQGAAGASTTATCPTWGGGAYGYNGTLTATCTYSQWNITGSCAPKECPALTVNNCGPGINCNLPAAGHGTVLSDSGVCGGGRGAAQGQSVTATCRYGQWSISGTCYNFCGGTRHNGTGSCSCGGCPCGECSSGSRTCNNGSWGGCSGCGCCSCPPPPPPPAPPPGPGPGPGPGCPDCCATTSGFCCSFGCNPSFCSGCNRCCTDCCCPAGCGDGVCGPACGGGCDQPCSDRRVKHDILWVGNYSGINIYEFSYIGDTARYRGVMAQEVLTFPGATIMGGDGILRVNYRVLGIPFEQVSP